MKLIKEITATIDYSKVIAWTEYLTDDDFIPYAVERLNINQMSLYLDSTEYTDYSTIYTAHRFYIIDDKRTGIGVRAEHNEYDDTYQVTIKTYQ